MSGSAAVATLSALNNWPGVPVYFQQRKVFLGSNQNPTGLWMTQPGNYKNMNVSNISRDDDAITETISAPPPGASAQVNAIRAACPMPAGLMVFSAGGAWQISAGQQGAAVTPSSITATAQAFSGISDSVCPLPIGYEVLYVQAKGSRVRDLSYNFFANVYTGQDISELAEHLVRNRQIVSWCWAEEPDKLVWAVRDDGILLSLTYVKEQEIFAWAWHDTQGLVEDVASISEGTRNAVYLVVFRYINGAWVRYVEQLAAQNYGENPQLGVAPDPALAFCVDAGLTYSRTFPAANIAFGATSGTGVLAAADVGIFSVGDVGKVIRGGGGLATVKAYVSPTIIQCDIAIPIASVIPDDPDSTPIPLNQNQWSMTTPITTVTGLGHLEGMIVSILADGVVIPQQTVTGGTVTLPWAATAVTVGLGFTWQLQTMPLNTGQPTTKGRRKMVNSVMTILSNSRGVTIGPSFDDMQAMDERGPDLLTTQATPFLNGEYRTNIDSSWDMATQICFQGTDPVPATISGVVMEVVFGDP